MLLHGHALITVGASSAKGNLLRRLHLARKGSIVEMAQAWAQKYLLGQVRVASLPA
jgi:hypothetical protein